MKFEEAVSNANIERSESTKPNDKTKIVSEVKATSGLRAMHAALRDAMVLAVRAELRWSPSFRDTALYCALLLEVRRNA